MTTMLDEDLVDVPDWLAQHIKEIKSLLNVEAVGHWNSQKLLR